MQSIYNRKIKLKSGVFFSFDENEKPGTWRRIRNLEWIITTRREYISNWFGGIGFEMDKMVFKLNNVAIK